MGRMDITKEDFDLGFRLVTEALQNARRRQGEDKRKYADVLFFPAEGKYEIGSPGAAFDFKGAKLAGCFTFDEFSKPSDIFNSIMNYVVGSIAE